MLLRMSESDGTGRKDDVVFLHGPSESGEGVRVIRKRDDAIELGELRPLREGQPIHGEVVRLSQREEHALLFDCEVVMPAPQRAEKGAPPKEPSPEPRAPRQLGHKGPPRVTSDAYRGGWDAIFGAKAGGSNNQPN